MLFRTTLITLAQARTPAPTGSNNGGRLVQPSAGEISNAIANKQGNAEALQWVVLGVAALLLTLAVIATYRYFRQTGRVEHPLRLFNRLARTAGLSLNEQWTLYRIARWQGLPSPITLMLDSTTLRVHAQAFATRLPPDKAERFQFTVRAIAQRMFNEPNLVLITPPTGLPEDLSPGEPVVLSRAA